MKDNFIQKVSKLFTVAKAFSLISIVSAHITFRIEYFPYISRVYSIIGSIGVIVYLFISGFYYNTEKYNSIWSMIKAKTTSIIIPWFFLGSLMYVYNSLMNGFRITLFDYLKWIVGYKTYLYFMSVLLICFVLFFYTKRIILFLSVFISALSLLATASGVLDEVVDFLHITHYLNIFNWIGFFACGKIISTVKAEKIYEFIKKTRYVMIMFFVLIIVALCVCNEIKVGYFSYIGPYLEILGAIFVFSISSFDLFDLDVVRNISNNSFAIYLIHMVVIGVSGKIVNISPITQLLSSIGVILVSHIVLEACHALFKILNAEKWFILFFGVRCRKMENI